MAHDLEKLERQLREGKGYILVKSETLGGETVCLASSEYTLPIQGGKLEGCVVYFLSELRHIAKEKPGPEQLRIIHEIKKTFGGLYTGTVPKVRQSENWIPDTRKVEARKKYLEYRERRNAKKSTRQNISDKRREFE